MKEKKQRNKRIVYEVDTAVIASNVSKLKCSKEVKEIRENFANRLNELLIENDMDQEQFAKKVNIAVGTLSNYRNGIREPSLSILKKIADVLNVSVNYLATGNECKDYTYEEVSSKTGLSQKALNQLYKMQHNDCPIYEDIERNFNEEKKISNQYKEELQLLSSIIENNVSLINMLENIKICKNCRERLHQLIKQYEETKDEKVYIEIVDTREKEQFAHYKATDFFNNIINDIKK